ncbi:hypothetical protein FE782_00720 [Paenibacillus antri]|uniref:Exo-alpha-sialidase n=1 Tax=Paenibacillus antri TaxID=2582848 RepID=A0A5R9GDS3_9BACL|nr:hypothetical protein [Paenibacillus antri]TLS53911.1 hypothetical protein FE782_00720 [Paenibacillus antri]
MNLWADARGPRVAVFAGIAVLAFVLALVWFLLAAGEGDPPPPLPPGSKYASADDGAPATLAQYWNGEAKWNYLRKDTQASTGVRSFFDGTQVKIMDDGTWYLFNRKILAADDACSSPLETQVRKSTDKGVTWSDPVVILPHTPDTPYSCAATDGDVWYNEAENKWHYLFQCLEGGSGARWQGCLLSREGEDPMGPFTIEPPGGNPVVSPGELWNEICDEFEDDCVSLSFGPRYVFDEGTFDIFEYDGSHHWVAFHGFDSTHGFRGIAKTADFQTWIAGDPSQGVPDDAIHDLNDSAVWREAWDVPFGNIGAGAGAMLKEGDYYYHLVEASDINLACNYNQNWNYGIYRSTSLTNTTWEQFPEGNPIIYSSKAEEDPDRGILPCNVQYAGVFQDPSDGFIYLMHGRRSNDPNYDGLYWYRLERSNNLLTNADLWRADTEGWTATGGASLAAPRLPNRSPNGTPYLHIDCSGCEAKASPGAYQDVDIPRIANGKARFGGGFYAEEAEGGLTIALHQMDANGKTIRSDELNVAATPEWASFDDVAELSSKTVRLRFEIRVRDAGISYRSDDLYLLTYIE